VNFMSNLPKISLPFDPPCHLCHRSHLVSNLRKAHDAGKGYAFYCEDCGISFGETSSSNVFCSTCGSELAENKEGNNRILIVPITDEIFNIYCRDCKEQKKKEMDARGEPIFSQKRLSTTQKDAMKEHLMNRRARREASKN